MVLKVIALQWLVTGLLSALIWVVTRKWMGRAFQRRDITGFIVILVMGPIAGFIAIIDNNVNEKLGRAEDHKSNQPSTTGA